MDDLRKMFGDRLLCYALACDITALDNSEWTAQQAVVVDSLGVLASRFKDQHPFQRQMSIADILLSSLPGSDVTVVDAWRMSCGGALIRNQAQEDRCLDLLLALAAHVYPGFLVHTTDEHLFVQGSPITRALFGTRIYVDFCRAVLVDDRLKRLFPAAPADPAILELDQLLDVCSYIEFSSGRSRTFQAVSVAETILRSAYDRLLLTREISCESYLKAVEAALSDVRKLAVKKEVQVPALVGLANVSLPAGCIINLPWGKLRPLENTDKKFIVGQTPTTVVLLTTTPLKILRMKAWDDDESSSLPLGSMNSDRLRFEQRDRVVRRTIDLSRFALLCATDDQPYFAARHVFTSVLDPVSHLPEMWGSFDVPVAARATSLEHSAVERVEHWGEKLKSHPSALDIAMRRTLSAIVDRLDPLDGFIDAVLAWENMFSGSPETTMKVCGAIAHLLERDDFDARSALYKKLHELYRKRSEVVHGSPEPSVRDATKFRDDAVRIGLDCVRRLYDHKDLLSKDAASRGKEILLGRLAAVLDDEVESVTEGLD